MEKINLFPTQLYHFEKFEWLDQLNILCDPIIASVKNNNKDEFAKVFHSQNLNSDNQFNFIHQFTLQQAESILNEQGFNLTNQRLALTSFWVQEFTSLGGGHHTLHTHWDGHISGFYFLKCSQNTSYPIFQDPRSGALMNKLPEKNTENVTDATSEFHIKCNPGTGLFFNSYLPHMFAVDSGKEPFRFIHWNIQVQSILV
jgi:uncharacterized protein (TIGR02466 family)